MPRKPPRSTEDRGGVPPRNGDGGREPQSRSDWGRMQGQAFLVTFAATGKSDSPGGEKGVSENKNLRNSSLGSYLQ